MEREAKAYVNGFGVVVEFPAGVYLNRDIWLLLTKAGFVKMRGSADYVNSLVTSESRIAADEAKDLFNSKAQAKTKQKLYPPGYFNRFKNGSK